METRLTASEQASLTRKLSSGEALSVEERAALCALLNGHRGYGLLFEEHPERAEERLRSELPVLEEVPERCILSEDPSAPCHSIIEGDNLEALTTLSYTHAGRIDLIYIDPPYNTGNRDFVYNDRFVDRTDQYRHSKWLSFMDKRLRIAKRLLAPEGVIFISIDDNEMAQLKLLCDNVFGEENFIGEVVWFKKRKGSFLSNKLVSLTEYLLPYSNGKVTLFGGRPDNNKLQPIIKRTNTIKQLSFKANTVITRLKDRIFRAGDYGKGTTSVKLLNDVTIKDRKFINDFTLEAPFTWSQKKVDQEIAAGSEIVINTDTFQVNAIRHNSESIKALPSFIDGREINATNEDAYEFLKQMFQTDTVFKYSKPCNLIKKIIQSVTYNRREAIILDFFAGSGTTLHATMQLNAEDGGHRQCILSTNNEQGICERVTYERNRRVIAGYETSKGHVSGLACNTLRYYRTLFVPRRPEARAELVRKATDMLRFMNDLYDEAAVDYADLTAEQARRFTAPDGRWMLVCYDTEVLDEVLDYLQEATTEAGPRVKVYIFSPNAYSYEEDFAALQGRVELCALPQAILDAYSSVLPAAGEPRPVEEDAEPPRGEEECVSGGNGADNASEWDNEEGEEYDEEDGEEDGEEGPSAQLSFDFAHNSTQP